MQSKQGKWLGTLAPHVNVPRSRARIAALALGVALFGATAHGAALTVSVDNVRAAEGSVRIVVYNEENWLNRQEWTQRALQPAARGTVAATFELPPGRYAVAVLHDVNGNGKMDTRMLRLPKEPYGFSNGAKPKLGPPQFEDAAFDLAEEDLAIAITLTD